jgi:hypothetical protein
MATVGQLFLISELPLMAACCPMRLPKPVALLGPVRMRKTDPLLPVMTGSYEATNFSARFPSQRLNVASRAQITRNTASGLFEHERGIGTEQPNVRRA